MATVLIYIAQDDDPDGGYYSAFSWKPDMRHERRSIGEVREVEMDADLWDFMLNQGGLPLDPDGTNDRTWLEWWATGRTVWSRTPPVGG